MAASGGDVVAASRSGEWARAVGPFAQTLVQIFKTMVAHPGSVYNQYSLRTLTRTYVDDDYERHAHYWRLGARSRDNSLLLPIVGEDATSLSLRYNYHAIAALALASSRLAPAALLPRALGHPRGVRYSRVRAPVMVLWGAEDSMMPANQLYRYRLALAASVHVHAHLIADAGHFAATDQPVAVTEELLKFFADLGGYGPPASAGGLLRRLHYIDARADRTPGLAQVYIGESGIWQGDEAALLDAANRRMHSARPPLRALAADRE